MRPEPSTIRTVAGQIIADREFVAGFAVGVIVLLIEIVAPAGWKLGLGVAGIGLLAIAFGFYLYRQVQLARLLHGDKPIPLMLAAGVPRRTALRNLEQIQGAVGQSTGFKQIGAIERFFNVHYEDLLAHRAEQPPTDPSAWSGFLEDGQQEVRQFLNHVSGEPVYHVAVHGPAALALFWAQNTRWWPINMLAVVTSG